MLNSCRREGIRTPETLSSLTVLPIAFPGAMALPDGVAAVARLGQLAVWSDACLRVHAPEQTVVAGRHSSVALGFNEEPLPAKRGTQVRVTGVEALALGFRNHAPPPL